MEQKINDLIVKIAESYIGQKEVTPNLKFVNPDFDKKIRNVGWSKGQSWCAYFLKLVYKEAFETYSEFEDVALKLKKIQSGSVVMSFNNFKMSKDFKISSTPTPGALVFWESTTKKGYGHCGIVVGIRDKNYIYTVEGNTNNNGSREGDGVYKKVRPISGYTGVRLLGYVSFSEKTKNLK